MRNFGLSGILHEIPKKTRLYERALLIYLTLSYRTVPDLTKPDLTRSNLT